MANISNIINPVRLARGYGTPSVLHPFKKDLYDMKMKNAVFISVDSGNFTTSESFAVRAIIKKTGVSLAEQTNLRNYISFSSVDWDNELAETTDWYPEVGRIDSNDGPYSTNWDRSLSQFYQSKYFSVSAQYGVINRTNLGRIYSSTFAKTIFNPTSYTDAQYNQVFGNYFLYDGGVAGSTYETVTVQNVSLDVTYADTFSGVILSNHFDETAPNSDKKRLADYIRLCMYNNGIVPQINYTSTSMDWDIYIDGTYNPNVRIKWHTDATNPNNNIDGILDISKIKISVYDTYDLVANNNYGSFDYSAKFHDTDYRQLYKAFDYDTFLEFADKIRNILTGSNLWIVLSCEYLGAEHKAYFCLTSSGKVPFYGIDPLSVGNEFDSIQIHFGVDESEKDKTSEEEEEERYPDNDTNKDEKDDNDNKNNKENPSSIIGTFNRTYGITPNRLNQLSDFLWNASFFDNIKLMNNSPIENIVSCKLFPFTIDGMADRVITLGNVESGVNGNPVNNTTFSARKNVGNMTCERVFNNFLDFEPFTKVDIYIPFIGFKQLQPSKVIGKNLKLEFIIDIITGSFKCIVFSNNLNIAEYDGNCAIDVPMSASNRAQVESSYLVGAIGLGATIGTGGMGALLSGSVSMAMSGYHTQTQGQASPSTGLYSNMYPYLLIDRPVFSMPNSYGKTKGFVCNKTLTIGSLKGFTICDPNVNLNGINATKEELEKIREYLTTGFFA